MYKKVTGIYIIQSTVKPWRVYIGSAWIIKQRWGQHLRELRNNEHHSLKLQRHYNKYGKDDLIFDIIESGEYFNNKHLLAREQGWLDHFKFKKSEIPYFNTATIAGSRKGVGASDATRALMSLQRKGKPQKNHAKGWHHTKETIDRLREINKGEGNPRYGKKASLETRKKGADARRGKPRKSISNERAKKTKQRHKNERLNLFQYNLIFNINE